MNILSVEKRNYNRVAFESVIKYSFYDGNHSSEWRIGRSKDISAGGLKFESVEVPRVTGRGEKVAIKFIRNNSEVCFYGQVRWCTGKQYGVQFRDVYTDLISEKSGLLVVNM